MTRFQGSAERWLDDLDLRVDQAGDDMGAFTKLLASRSAETCLPNLRAAADNIGLAFPRRPVSHPRYMAQWIEFVSGKRGDLDQGTMRYLCWEPTVATDNQFLAYVQKSGMELTRRPLAGLVRSCQSRWEDSFSADSSVDVIRTFVNTYAGLSPVILKWKSNPDAVLGRTGPEILGRSLVEENRKLLALLEEWYLDPRSPFVHKVVESAAAICRSELVRPSRSLLELLFGELLPWPGWKPSRLKQEVGALILHGTAIGQTGEILRKFILKHPNLGDPRLPANRNKWAEVPQEARNRVLLWLSENPFSLLDHVHQKGTGWTWRPRDNGSDESRFGQRLNEA